MTQKSRLLDNDRLSSTYRDEEDSDTGTITQPPLDKEGLITPIPSPTGSTRFITIVTACACIGSFLFGYDTGVISGALLFINPYYQIGSWGSTSAEQGSNFMSGLVVAITLVGSAVGSTGGWISNKYGRRKTLLSASILFIFGGLIMFFAPHVSVLVIGRFVVGLAIGIASIVIPVYIAEVAPENIRGRLGSTPQLMVSTGVLTSYLMDVLVSWLAFKYQWSNKDTFEGGEWLKAPWRAMLGFSIVPAILMGLALNFVPESPRWLYLQDRKEEAQEVLCKVYGKKDVSLDLLVISAQDKEQSSVSSGSKVGLREILFGNSRPLVRRMLLVAIALQIFQQFTGINAVVYYTPELFTAVDITQLFTDIGIHLDDATASLLATALVYAFKIPAILITMRLMDSWGRRTVLLVGIPIMACCLATLAICFRYSEVNGYSLGITITATITILMFGMSFSSSFGPIPLMFAAEVFPNDVRGQCTTIVTMCNWTANFIVSLTFPSLAKNYLFETFLFFVGTCIVAVIFIYFFMPETKGVTLEQMYARIETEQERSRLCMASLSNCCGMRTTSRDPHSWREE